MNALTDIPSRRRQLLLPAALILLCALCGGSSRIDNPSLLVVRPLAIICLITALILPGRRDWSGLRTPLLLLGAFAATIAVQLVPLPPAIWTSLPGHARFVEAAAAVGAAQPWRPISVAPDMTFNSLLALSIPLAVLVTGATVAPRVRAGLLPVLLATIGASVILGIAQWAGSLSSPLYLFENVDRGLPVGFFANRNHQAVFIAMALPLLRAWAVLPSTIVQSERARIWIAGAAALLVVPVVLATGSRSGTVVALLGAVAAFVVAPPVWRAPTPGGPTRRRALALALVAALVIAIIGGAIAVGRAPSILRISQVDKVMTDLRIQNLPIVLDITRDFLPFGTGYGTFDPMFRLYEPFWALQPSYFNRAHNDLLELVMTGGLPALAVLLVFLAAVVARLRALVAHGWRRRSCVISKCGLALVVMSFAASLTDYLLRTPAMSMVFAIAALWLFLPDQEAGSPPDRVG